MTDHLRDQGPETMEHSAATAAATARLNYDDHDLLIRIDTHLELMSKDFDGFKININTELNKLWSAKANAAEFVAYQAQHVREHEEMRGNIRANEEHLGNVERKLYWVVGIMVGLQIAVEVLLRAVWKA